jgi:hypothetical protein
MTAPPIFVYLVLPLATQGDRGIGPKLNLAKLVTRDSMIGVMDPLPAVPTP